MKYIILKNFKSISYVNIIFIFYLFIRVFLNEKICNITIFSINAIEFDCAIEKKK